LLLFRPLADQPRHAIGKESWPMSDACTGLGLLRAKHGLHLVCRPWARWLPHFALQACWGASTCGLARPGHRRLLDRQTPSTRCQAAWQAAWEVKKQGPKAGTSPSGFRGGVKACGFGEHRVPAWCVGEGGGGVAAHATRGWGRGSPREEKHTCRAPKVCPFSFFTNIHWPPVERWRPQQASDKHPARPVLWLPAHRQFEMAAIGPRSQPCKASRHLKSFSGQAQPPKYPKAGWCSCRGQANRQARHGPARFVPEELSGPTCAGTRSLQMSASARYVCCRAAVEKSRRLGAARESDEKTLWPKQRLSGHLAGDTTQYVMRLDD